jgi:hypothetical protein
MVQYCNIPVGTVSTSASPLTNRRNKKSPGVYPPGLSEKLTLGKAGDVRT